MKNKNIFKTVLTGIMICGLTTILVAKDALDVLDKSRVAGRTFMPVSGQTYVYHTNGDLWMGWDSYGNTGDQTCSAIIPGWVYPGANESAGHGYLNYNCRAGYWIIADIGGTLYEGTTGQYDISEGTDPGETSSGWAGNDGDYNKEPWVTTTTWSIPSAGLDVVATRRSWSFNGTANTYFKIGEHDYNDFVIDEIHVINNGTVGAVDELVLGSKADHDCTWNVPFPDWDYAFWTDDIVDYDANYMLTMELDGDDPGSASNDFGIDDPAREYRGVRVAQTPLNIAGTAYGSLTAADVNHMWWTGDEDPQTVAARYAMATMVSGTGDKKDNNPTPMDMRYLQSYSGGSLAVGDTATFVVAVLAGAGLANTQQAAANARKAYDWGWNLPKPPAAPQIAADGVKTNAAGKVEVTWSYSDAQIAAADPDKGTADFAGFRIYKAATAPRQSSADIMSAEDVSADNSTEGGTMVGDPSVGTKFTSASTGPYSLVLDIPAASVGDYGGNGTYTWTDENVAIGLTYWYYVAAYDAAGSDATHGSVPSLESYYTMCYPMQPAPDGGGGVISDTPPATTVSVESLTYEGLEGSTDDVFVAPNPWRGSVMETFHGATTANSYFVRFYNVKSGDPIRVFDVGGNLVYESSATATGSFDWNLVSRTRNQVVTGMYYWQVGDQSGKLAVIR